MSGKQYQDRGDEVVVEVDGEDREVETPQEVESHDADDLVESHDADDQVESQNSYYSDLRGLQKIHLVERVPRSTRRPPSSMGKRSGAIPIGWGATKRKSRFGEFEEISIPAYADYLDGNEDSDYVIENETQSVDEQEEEVSAAQEEQEAHSRAPAAVSRVSSRRSPMKSSEAKDKDEEPCSSKKAKPKSQLYDLCEPSYDDGFAVVEEKVVSPKRHVTAKAKQPIAPRRGRTVSRASSRRPPTESPPSERATDKDDEEPCSSKKAKPKSRLSEFAMASLVEEEEVVPCLAKLQNAHRSARTVSRESSRRPQMESPPPERATDNKDEEPCSSKNKAKSNRRRRNKQKKQWIALFDKTMLIELTVFLCILACLVASFTVEKLENLMLWGLGTWKWCVLVMVIYCGMFVAKWFLRFSIFVIETKFFPRKEKLVYCVQGMEESARVVIWLGFVVLAWLVLFNRTGVVEMERSKTCTRILHYAFWTLVSVFVGAFLWMMKTLLLKFLAFDFQSYTFFGRIQESMFHQGVLRDLSGNPLRCKAAPSSSTTTAASKNFRITQRKNAEREEQAMDMVARDLQKIEMKQNKVSPWTMKVLVNAVSTSGFTLRDTEDSADERKYKVITSEIEAATAASYIFENVAEPPSRYISKSDLMKFLTKEQVKLVYPLIDVAKAGKIGRNDLKNYVVKVYKDREALSYALQDTKTAEKQFNRLVTGILIVITVIVWLLLLEIANTKVLVLLSSQIVLAAFMFGNTCKNIFEALVFVFVIHPFDVGDRCVVDDVPLIVEEMTIFTTVFLKANYEKVYYPNSVLATKIISNYYRSSDMKDSVEFSIALTPVAKIDKLKERIKRYLEGKPEYWHPKHNVVVKDFEDVNKLKMAVYFHHTMNFQEFEEKDVRRAELVFELLKILEKLSITYSMPPQEVDLKTKSEETAA